jgi:hypothetical protein
MERVRLEEGENMTELKEFEKNNNGHGRVVCNLFTPVETN